MQELSTALQNAIDAGNPQRVLLIFGEEELTNEDLAISQGVTLNEEFNPDEDLTIGDCPSSIISFSLINDNGQLEDFEFGWFSAFLGARIDTGTPTEITRQFTEGGQTVTYAFAPLGIFYADKPKVLKKKVISITAYDQMMLLERDMPSATALNLTYPTTLGGIFSAICSYVGITPASGTFLNSSLDVASAPSELTNATIRQVIGWIAECACSIARFGRDGKLEFAWFTNSQRNYSESNYSEFTPAWYETEAINGAYFRDTENSVEETEGTDKTNNYLILNNPFLKGA